MNDTTLGALTRIIEEVEEKRKAECLMKNCIINDMIGGDDIALVKMWMKDNETTCTRKEIRTELKTIHGYLDPNEDHDMEDVQNEITHLIKNI